MHFVFPSLKLHCITSSRFYGNTGADNIWNVSLTMGFFFFIFYLIKLNPLLLVRKKKEEELPEFMRHLRSSFALDSDGDAQKAIFYLYDWASKGEITCHCQVLRGGLLCEHKRKQAAINGKPLLCCLFIPVKMFGSTCTRTCPRVPLAHTHFIIIMSIISIFKSSCVIETSDTHKRKPHEKSAGFCWQTDACALQLTSGAYASLH